MLDPVFASVIVTSLVSIVALVAIVYGQKDIATLALKVLGKSLDTKPEDTKKPEDDQDTE